jgi:dTDP-3-amino-3,4,6-trideoxy-alpha-D-glucose transaminase
VTAAHRIRGARPPAKSAPPAQKTVPFVCLRRQHGPLAGELAAAARRVVESDRYILGEEVEAFEAEFAEYCGARYCVGVASGTAALTIALIAAGVGRGDEVILPAHTYIATALAVVHAGATPVVCDVEHGTGLIDPIAAAAVVGPHTAAIIPVHLYGQVCDMERICALARRHGLLVLEDAAQAHGATASGRRAGSLGQVAAFSFYPSKNLGALGDAGAVCTSDHLLADRARRLRNMGQERKNVHTMLGFNERLDSLQAAVLRAKLGRLNDWNAARRRHAGRYRAALADTVGLLEEGETTPCVYHVFPIRVRRRDDVLAHLRTRSIDCGVHYPVAVPDHPVLRGRFAASAELPNARRWAQEEISLPMFAELTTDEIDRVVESLGELTSADTLRPLSPAAQHDFPRRRQATHVRP